MNRLAGVTQQQRYRDWALGFVAATLYTLLQATQQVIRDPTVGWFQYLLMELPVWWSLFLVSPAIVFAANRLPLFGARTLVNAIAHLAPALVILFTLFFITEAARAYIAQPLVMKLGIATSENARYLATYGSGTPIYERAYGVFRNYVVFFLVIYYAIVSLHNAASHYRQLLESRLHSEELEHLLARSQLDALRLQLHPHFLFNSLNTVAALMTRDVGLARKTLARLSDLLRSAISDPSEHEISVESEMRFLQGYIDIQKARYESRLEVSIDVAPEANELLLPRMILQPIVENAIHHGMKDGSDTLNIGIRAERQNGDLYLSVRDDGRGIDQETFREGIGLRNTKERLEYLYPRSAFEMKPADGGGVDVVIALPARSSNRLS